MHIDKTDILLLRDISEHPGKALRFYADRHWTEHGILSRSGALFRLERLAVNHLIELTVIHCRLKAVTITDQGKMVVSGVQQA